MNSDLVMLCERIDSHIFTGDSLFDKETRKEFQYYLGRWNRNSKDEQWIKEEENE